jgi:hypothetical protein
MRSIMLNIQKWMIGEVSQGEEIRSYFLINASEETKSTWVLDTAVSPTIA